MNVADTLRGGENTQMAEAFFDYGGTRYPIVKFEFTLEPRQFALTPEMFNAQPFFIEDYYRDTPVVNDLDDDPSFARFCATLREED
jgi:hypothetical protein